MSFAAPYMFLLLLMIPLFLFRKNKQISLSFSTVSFIPEIIRRSGRRKKKILKTIESLILILIIIALARPRSAKEEVWQESEGIDIVLTVDVSSSMLAEDFSYKEKRYSRLEIVRSVIREFINKRKGDRIGITMFAGETMTVCPLTSDISVLDEFLKQLEVNILPDGTAIGDGLAFAVNRLKGTEGKSKVIVLLTDGANNAGSVTPSLAAEIALTQNVRVYTIGAGKKGEVPYPYMDPFFGTKQYKMVELPIDESILKEIAEKTEGRFFRATNTDELVQIYDDIDEMEKIKVRTGKAVEYKELFYWFLFPAICLLFLLIILENTFLMRLP